MTTRTDAIREALARPQRPDPRVVELLSELGAIAAEIEEYESGPEVVPLWKAIRHTTLTTRAAAIEAELERLVQVDVPKEVLT